MENVRRLMDDFSFSEKQYDRVLQGRKTENASLTKLAKEKEKEKQRKGNKIILPLSHYLHLYVYHQPPLHRSA
jgi:ABC-type cobalamin transport system ATPase subunit